MCELRILDVEAEPDATPLKAWQLSRDLVITAARNSGASPELLGEVFNLDPRRIKQIIARTRKRYEANPGRRAPRQPQLSRRFVA